MPSGCTKCPGCGNDTLQPFPARGKAYCLHTADCGYSESLEPDCHTQVAALVGALERRTPDNPYDSGGLCSFCGSYDDHYRCCSWQQARTLLANLPAEALKIARKAQAHDEMAAALEDVCWQFAYRSTRGRRLFLHAGCLSALEGAFDVLGWPDPKPVSIENACEVKGCFEWSTCGWHWGDLYLHLCSEHRKDADQDKPCPPIRSHALRREAQRGPDGILSRAALVQREPE